MQDTHCVCVGEAYPSAEVQSVDSTASADWAMEVMSINPIFWGVNIWLCLDKSVRVQ